MKNLAASYYLFGLSYVAGAIYVLLTVFRERYDAVLACLFIIFAGSGVLINSKERTAERVVLAHVLIILWAVLAICMLHGNIGWAFYFTALIIIPSLVSIGMRLMESRRDE